MKVHEIKGYIQSTYLVDYPYGLFLLDSACRCDVDVIMDFIEHDLKRPRSDLKLVLVTHMHPDHAGGADLFRSKYKIPVASMVKDRQFYGGAAGPLQQKLDIFLGYWVAHRKKQDFRWMFYPRKLKVDIPLNDGDLIPGFEEWSVIESPGHTDRDISFFHRKSGLAYLGDVVIKLRKGFCPPIPVKQPEDYKATLDRLAEYPIKEVLLAHGGRTAIKSDDFLSMKSAISATPKDYEVAVDVVKSVVRGFFSSKR